VLQKNRKREINKIKRLKKFEFFYGDKGVGEEYQS